MERVTSMLPSAAPLWLHHCLKALSCRLARHALSRLLGLILVLLISLASSQQQQQQQQYEGQRLHGISHAGSRSSRPHAHGRRAHDAEPMDKAQLGSEAGSQDPAVAENWRTYMHQLNSVTVSNQKLSNLLGPILNYQFSLPEVQLRKGLVYMGSNFRLRRAVRDLITGKRPVKIGLIGGSISWGSGPSQRGVTDWFSVFSRYVRSAFPHANVTLRNGCVPGTPSSYMIMCLEVSVDPDVDIVFSEYCLNDGFDTQNRMYNNERVLISERLTRRVLALPSNPAMINLQIISHGMAIEPGADGRKPFPETTEDLYGAISQYYDVPWLSFRTALYRLSNFNKAKGYRWSNVMADDLFHPGDGGHKVMADLAVWLFQQTALDLMLRPFSRQDAEMMEEKLPEPMYPGNEAPSSALCLYQDLLRPLVVNDTGWAFVNEGTEAKPKKGYVSSQPGTELRLKVNTQRDGSGARVPVYLAHLRSYVGMGVATVRCVSGCDCGAKEVDAHQGVRESQTYLALLEASQHPECVVSVTVESKFNASNGGGHKFKVSGIMLAESANGQPRYEIPEGRFAMSGAHEHLQQGSWDN